MTMKKEDDLATDPILKEVPDVDGYKLLEPCVLYARVGQGGMGAVYRGTHLRFNLDVGIKCLHPHLAAAHGHLVVRFEREAKLAAMLNHPNLVRVFDVDQRHGVHYLVMEFVRGETARERVVRKGEGLKVGEAAIIALGAARGLAAAHESGVVHRDLKPDNIMISRTGEVKVADLGLGRLAEDDDQTGMLTQTGLRMGTPRYMPPEQWDGLANVAAPGDVWALGATMYFLLAGKDSYGSDSRVEIMKKICLEPFPDVRRRRKDVPEAFVRVIEKCTRIKPEERYPNAQELVEDLERVIRDEGLHGVLQDPESGAGTTRCELVSPPPPELLAKMRVTMTGDGGVAPTVFHAGRTSEVDSAIPTMAGTGTQPSPSSSPRFWALAIVAVLAISALGSIAYKEWGARRASSDSLDIDLASQDDLEQADREPNEPPIEASGLVAQGGGEQRSTASGRKKNPWDAYRELLESADEGPETESFLNAYGRAIESELGSLLRIEGLPRPGSVHSEAALDLKVSLVEHRADLFGVRVGDTELVREGSSFVGRIEGLVEGPQRLTLHAVAMRAEGPETRRSLNVTVDTAEPVLQQLQLQGPAGAIALAAFPQENWLRAAAVRLSGTVTDATEVTLEVLVDGIPAPTEVQRDGMAWTADLRLNEGLQTVSVRARDQAGWASASSFNAGFDPADPVIAFRSPQTNPFETSAATLRVLLACSDRVGTIAEVLLDRRAIEPSGSRTLPLRLGSNRFEVVARDLSGRTTRETLEVTRREPARTSSDPLAGEPIALAPEPEDDRLPVRRDDVSGSERADVGVEPTTDNPPPPIEGFRFVRWNEFRLAEFEHEATNIRMVLVPGGSFEMGARTEDGQAASPEGPLHTVELDSFLIAKYETRQREWLAVFPGQNRSRFDGNPELPVESIPWYACEAFCKERGLALPTEAQWEYACRAGSDSGIYGDLDTLGGNEANFGSGANGRTSAVGSYPANGFGLHDMVGNVHEFCRDAYDPGFYASGAATKANPFCVTKTKKRVLRGGAWSSSAEACRASARFGLKQDSAPTAGDVGFRVVYELPAD